MSNLKQDFSVLIFQLFRTAGFALNIDQSEKLRETSDKVVAAIENIAKERAIELVRVMQKAISEGFTEIGKDVTKLEARLDKLETKKTRTSPKEELIREKVTPEHGFPNIGVDPEEEHGCRPDGYVEPV